MDSNSKSCKPSRRSMYGSKSVLLAAAFMILVVDVALAQEKPVRDQVRILEQSDSEMRRFVVEALDRGLPQDMVDQLAVLAMNRSRLVVSEIVPRLDTAWRDPAAASVESIQAMADIIAYAADDVALDALVGLASSNYTRFGYFIGRTLDYARGRRNPYSLAYYVIGKGTSEVDDGVISWVRANASLGKGYPDWAAAIIERHEGISTETIQAILLQDTIVSRIGIDIPTPLHREVLNLVKTRDSTRKRQER